MAGHDGTPTERAARERASRDQASQTPQDQLAKDEGAKEQTPKEHRTVTRVTTILETAAASDGVRLAALCAVLDAPKSSVHGLVQGLVATGYLTERRGGYVLGPAAGALLAAVRPALADLARPAMERLRREFDETVMLGEPVGDSIVYVRVLESSQVIRYSAPLRTRRPLYPTSTGKVVLAHRDTARRNAYLRAHVPDEGRRARVREELTAVAAEGVAFNRGETLPDVSATAAGVFAGGRLVACLAVAGPTPRTAARLDTIADAVRAAAAELSDELSRTGGAAE
ncbi:IclR family transcriptional regulator [Streptomyces varsoviensis]|uniref:IclR family transcriptional regulator n=1 Tax=Streptomyces varsoviensis TaxID=67373 RepID=UPI000AE51ED6|nr:IclR family transcriptional regulator C-terminal domain-containing protein [Streptomyces varsoviensis]